MKHTKGPWKIDEYGDISSSRGIKVVIDENMKKANARLIASAPDLLEACKFTLTCIKENWSDLSNAGAMLEQAISKAEERNKK
jgi:hypothetical protein